MSTVIERLRVEGVVQGVGFRPFVYRLATELGLAGHVGNDSSSVFIEAVGRPDELEEFADRLVTEAPPLARIERLVRRRTDRSTAAAARFEIVDSRAVAGRRTLVSPDTAVCDACVRELFDPADRRYRHPFITCTDCGPRFTIVTSLPYDRPNTTMAGFAMCAACRREYDDPADRRYHAQPIACHECGPQLSYTGWSPAAAFPDDDPIRRAAAALAAGEIVAVKGLGGYHLVCDGRDDDVVAELRRRKRRPDKPFAVLVADLDGARDLAVVDRESAALLASPAAPIVLLTARDESPLSPVVAPGNPLVGLALPYTPIHHLLVAEHRGPLVLTSANRGGEPIAWDRSSIESLGDLYDARLDHDRPIQLPCDDSVVRVVDGRPLPIRRSRGYAPIPVTLPDTDRSVAAVLAVGAELKNTFCLAAGGHAWVGQHIGDMRNLATLDAFATATAQFRELYGVEPEVVAADAHPDYLSSKWARDHHPERLRRVQHHHAHVAAVMAEAALAPRAPVLGFAFDGTGYGLDGTIWGGELLVATAERFERVAHLAAVPLPGGDAAIRSPARVALAHLHTAGLPWSRSVASVASHREAELELLRRQLAQGVACVPTTSMGRLFDAVASLVGLRHEITYEAQAAIDLEIAAARAQREHGESTERNGYRFGLDGPSISSAPVLAAILADLDAHVPAGVIAARFHHAVAEIVDRLAVDQRARTGIATVVLSGGVFQNVLLSQLCVERLTRHGFDVHTHTLVPPNDGGLALGQAYIASYAGPDPQPSNR